MRAQFHCALLVLRYLCRACRGALCTLLGLFRTVVPAASTGWQCAPLMLILLVCVIWPGVAGASGAVARAPRQPLHVTTWLAPRHPHASRPFPVGEMLADPPFKRGVVLPITATPSASSVTASSLFPHPPAPLSGSLEIGGVRAGARESPGQPLGRPPSQGPPRRVVPDEAAALRSRTGPAPRLRQPPK